MIKVLGIIPMVGLISAATAHAYDVNGYAVSNFRPCNAGNLPATIVELERFFSSENFPEDARKNFLWTDSRVRQSDWDAESDSFENLATANGLDGADSSLIAYIASHGITSNGVYSAIAGTSREGGCYMSTSDMLMGDQFARYAVLSTCQGLKIGTGSSPTRPGEDPSITWQDAAPGMNCIFGYSNNMQDATGYGEYWLDHLATGDDTLTEAFFKASRQVSYSNIPAVLCFGSDEDQARYNLENMTSFTSEQVGGETSVWAYSDSRRINGTFEWNFGKAAPSVSMSVPYGAIEKLATKGVLKFNAEHGTLTYSNKSRALTKPIEIQDVEVVEIAQKFLLAQGMGADTWSAVPSYIIDKGTKVGGQKIVTEKTVVMHQTFGNVFALGTAGSFEINVNADGIVTKATLAPRTFAQPQGQETKSVNAVTIDDAKAQALGNLGMRYPNAILTTQGIRIGFDSDSYLVKKTQAKAVVEVEVAVEEGGLSRVFVERLAL